MHDVVVKALDQVRGSWRFRWWALAAAWTACLAGWLYVMALPNVFRASATVYVDTQSVLRPLLKGLAVDPNVESSLAIVRQAILSRPHLEKVARATDLDLRAKTPEAMERLLQSLGTRVEISADARARSSASDGLYTIAFRDFNRAKSLEVVRNLLDSFVEDTLGSKRAGQKGAQQFLRDQIAEYERRLTDAESRLSEFKKRHVGVMPSDRGDYFARLQADMTGLESAQTALRLAESRRDELSRQLTGEEPFMFGFDTTSADTGRDSASGTDVAGRIREMERRLEELLLRYTPKHPEVIAVKDTLKELKQQQAEELDRLRKTKRGTGSLSSSLKANPVYQSIIVDQKRAEVQVAELRQDVAQRQARVGELRRMVNTVPEVEAELARLNRDYEVTRGQYQALVQRLDTARLSEDADRTGIVKFEIIDPPAVPFDPVAPKRVQLLAGVLVFSLLFGVGVAYLLNLLRPVFHNARALAEVTGLPVLGSVTRTWRERHRAVARLQIALFSGGTALLLIVFAGVVLWRDAGVRLVERFHG
jgi:polysaccharide chain length determinant protein (PEP-CTERM system associated)